MLKPAIALAWLFSGLLVLWHLFLAINLSYGLKLLVMLEVPLALVLIVVAMSRRRFVSRLSPLILALLSPIWFISYYPYFINQRVAQVGASLLVKDAVALCEQYRALKWEEQDKPEWKRISPGDRRFPESFRRLNPIYATLSGESVELKMGGMLDEYQGLLIRADVPPGTLIEVDWTQTWETRSYEESGLHRTQRLIAPGIEWRTWSAP